MADWSEADLSLDCDVCGKTVMEGYRQSEDDYRFYCSKACLENGGGDPTTAYDTRTELGLDEGDTTDHWSDLDRALFWLDQAGQSIVDEFHAPMWREAMTLLEKHQARIVQLRREYAVGGEGSGADGNG